MSRIVMCVVLFAVSGLLVCRQAEPVTAQEKKDKDKDKDRIAALEKQVNALKTENAQNDKQIAALKNDVLILKTLNTKLATENTRLEGLIKKDKIDDKKDDKTLKDLQVVVDGYRGAGLVHVVILKLKSDSPSTEPQSLIDETYSQLSKIKTVRGVWAGKPASKGTPDANVDYTVALVFVFDNADGLKTYLNDSIHTKFADKHLKKWETPVVYDFEPKKPAP